MRYVADRAWKESAGLHVEGSAGIWQKKSLYGREFMGIARTTYLIGADGKVAKRWDNVNVDGHADAVLEVVLQL